MNLGPADPPQCPRECDHFCILKSNGPICSCKPGFRLYDDLKTCVLTEELLEEAAEELSDDVALPVVIVLIVGFLGKINPNYFVEFPNSIKYEKIPLKLLFF